MSMRPGGLTEGEADGVAEEDERDWYRDLSVRLSERIAVLVPQLAAAERTIEQLGQDAAAIAGRLDRAVELLRRHLGGTTPPKPGRPCPATVPCACCDTHIFLASLASPSQPEPVETHAFVELLGPPGPPRECRTCGNPDGPPWHAPIVPENAGTTCSACKGKGGFDPFGGPMERQTNPAYQCGACQGRGTK